MIRVPSICINTYGDGEVNLLREIYEHVKHDIPKELAKRYEYYGRGQLNLPLPKDSLSYHYVMDMSVKYNLNPTIFQIVYYTQTEIEKSEYFQMYIVSPLEIEGTDAADYGTQYEGGCQNPTCRLGKRLIGDALVDRKFLNQKKWDIGTLRPDIYVSENLKRLMCENGLTGVSFEHEVKDFKGREMPRFHVMEINNVLPPMATSTWLIQDEYIHQWYKDCGHQVTYLRSDVQYERDKLEGASDFNLSAEYVDNFRLQIIIVSARARKLFRRHKIYVRFSPIAIL